MAWKVELDPAVERDLDRLDRQVARGILEFQNQRVTPHGQSAPIFKTIRILAWDRGENLNHANPSAVLCEARLTGRLNSPFHPKA